MKLRAGLRLQSATCLTQVIVVRAPKDADVDLRCGGQPLLEIGSTDPKVPIAEGFATATLLGKRYADDELGLELLCTVAGEGGLSLGDTPLEVKGAKPLPSSD